MGLQNRLFSHKAQSRGQLSQSDAITFFHFISKYGNGGPRFYILNSIINYNVVHQWKITQIQILFLGKMTGKTASTVVTKMQHVILSVIYEAMRVFWSVNGKSYHLLSAHILIFSLSMCTEETDSSERATSLRPCRTELGTRRRQQSRAEQSATRVMLADSRL